MDLDNKYLIFPQIIHRKEKNLRCTDFQQIKLVWPYPIMTDSVLLSYSCSSQAPSSDQFKAVDCIEESQENGGKSLWSLHSFCFHAICGHVLFCTLSLKASVLPLKYSVRFFKGDILIRQYGLFSKSDNKEHTWLQNDIKIQWNVTEYLLVWASRRLRMKPTVVEISNCRDLTFSLNLIDFCHVAYCSKNLVMLFRLFFQHCLYHLFDLK